MEGNLNCTFFEDLITQTVALNSVTHLPHPDNIFSGLQCCYCLQIRQYERLQVLAVVSIKTTVLWDVTWVVC